MSEPGRPPGDPEDRDDRGDRGDRGNRDDRGDRNDRDDRDDIDRQFLEIVRGLGGEPRERASDPIPPPSSPPRPSPPRRHLGPGTPEGMATDHRSYEPPEDPDEEHFVPPPTPPLPAGDLHYWGIVLGLVGGPLLVLLSAVIPLLSIGWTAVGTVLTLAGFVLLVLRSPRHRRDDDDLGARV